MARMSNFYTCDVPENFEDENVLARYTVVEGGWGPVPELILRCKHCRRNYGTRGPSQRAPDDTSPIKAPDPEKMKERMRKDCPLGGAEACKL